MKVVYSKEPPISPVDDDATGCRKNCVCPPGTQRTCAVRRQVPGSVAFVPSVAGLILAGEVIRAIAGTLAARTRSPNNLNDNIIWKVLYEDIDKGGAMRCA